MIFVMISPWFFLPKKKKKKVLGLIGYKFVSFFSVILCVNGLFTSSLLLSGIVYSFSQTSIDYIYMISENVIVDESLMPRYFYREINPVKNRF